MWGTRHSMTDSIVRATGAKKEYASRAAEEAIKGLKSGKLNGASFVGSTGGALVAVYELYQAWKQNEKTAPK